MSLLAGILIGEPLWLLATLGIVVVTGALLWWSYRLMRSADRPTRSLAVFLKVAGIGILAICLAEPLWSGVRAKPGANLFVVLADNSKSMQVCDKGESTSRGVRLSNLFKESPIKEHKSWQARLGQDFDVRRFRFDSSLQQADNLTALKFDGASSSVGRALGAVRERFQGRPVGGILLLTDGNATDLDEGSLQLNDMPPVYPVVFGKATARDIWIQKTAVSQTSFEDSPVSIQVDVASTGFADHQIVAQLMDESGKEVKRETRPSGDESVPLPFRFQVRPTKPGISFYRVRVGTAEGIDSEDEKKQPAEATLGNNTRLIKVDRGKGPHRILYVGGRPNWELKFLRRAIEDDEQIDLVGLIRVARREAKFDFRGRDDESSNALFRGFKKERDEETESYDQPVLIRLNTKDAEELRDGFPKSKEALFQYKAILLDDIEAAFFTQDQLTLLQKFVSDRGGSVLMLGGQECFQQGGYHRTPVGEMLPVYLDRLPDEPASRVRLSLTRTGWLRPWVRLRNNENDERKRIEQMPQFFIMNRVSGIKPGATILATATDESGKQHPALVVQRFGNGRSAAMTIGDLWRWQLKRQDDNDDLGKAWRQMLRWMVVDVKDRVSVDVQPQRKIADGAVRLLVRVHDEEFQPLDNAAIAIKIVRPAENSGSQPETPAVPIEIEAEASLAEPGLYEVVFTAKEAGAYRATIEVKDSDGKPVATTETGWVNDPAGAEFQNVAPNLRLLQEIADATDGEIIDVGRLDRFVAGLSARSMPVNERWSSPLWDQPWVFMLVLCCLIGEWGLRRWKGLP